MWIAVNCNDWGHISHRVHDVQLCVAAWLLIKIMTWLEGFVFDLHDSKSHLCPSVSGGIEAFLDLNERLRRCSCPLMECVLWAYLNSFSLLCEMGKLFLCLCWLCKCLCAYKKQHKHIVFYLKGIRLLTGIDQLSERAHGWLKWCHDKSHHHSLSLGSLTCDASALYLSITKYLSKSEGEVHPLNDAYIWFLKFPH